MVKILRDPTRMLVVVALVLGATSCGGRPEEYGPPARGRAGAPPTRAVTAARAFLLDGQHEARQYGLYSYLLFADPPSPAALPRYRAAISAFLELDPVEEMSKYIAPDLINITYAPIRETGNGQPRSVDDVLRRYNYARAKAILSAIDVSLTSGPYIVSSRQPIVPGQVPTGEYLWQDISTVPPELERLWIREYLHHAVNEDGFFDQEARATWTTRLRTALAITAAGVPEVQKAMSTLVRWIKTGETGEGMRSGV